ncbi:hypothetical protein [Corallococcus llansteffanensis]|nr:hypothetical protein [Corallococcus llansteffanensis]
MPAHTSYTFAEWTTPTAPSEAKALIGGLSIHQVGTPHHSSMEMR